MSIASRRESSAARSASDFPPPFVRKTKGMPFRWRYCKVSTAPGMGFDLCSSTPSMLEPRLAPFGNATKEDPTHSKQKAKLGSVSVVGAENHLTEATVLPLLADHPREECGRKALLLKRHVDASVPMDRESPRSKNWLRRVSPGLRPSTRADANAFIAAAVRACSSWSVF